MSKGNTPPSGKRMPDGPAPDAGYKSKKMPDGESPNCAACFTGERVFTLEEKNCLDGADGI